MGSSIVSAERNRAAAVRAMRRKQEEMRSKKKRNRCKARRWLKKACVIASMFYFGCERWLWSDAIDARWFLRAIIKRNKGCPGAHAHWWMTEDRRVSAEVGFWSESF
ncbi:hypothetical protein QQF64_012914, partial [Cirrhinus molitorella]